MADIDLLNAVQSQQTEPSNQDVVDAVHQSQWANTFQNTPPAEVLRSRVNLADTVNRAFDNKLALAARSDAGALSLMQKNAQFQEFQRQAPLREQLLQAHIDATGATERRKAAESTLEANDTAGLNNDIAGLYAKGLKKDSPDFQSAALQSIAKYPHARLDHVAHVAGIVGGGADDVDYTTLGSEVQKAQKIADDNGWKNYRITLYKGHPYPVQEAVSPHAGPEGKIADTESNMVDNPLSLHFGNVDEDGKLVQSKASDKTGGKATHVNVRFVGPSGEIHDSRPITIEEYQKLQERVKARKSAPPPVADVLDEATPPGSPTSHTPAGTPSTPPVLTSKAQFDSLPSGAHYIRDGKAYQKP